VGTLGIPEPCDATPSHLDATGSSGDRMRRNEMATRRRPARTTTAKRTNTRTGHGNLDSFLPNTARGGYALAVAGYLPDGRFIIRNS